MPNDKLDYIVEILEKVLETQEELVEGQARIEEAIANLSLPGSGYGVEEYDS